MFGWSRSASRGSNVWENKSRNASRSASRIPSPDFSDDEIGDYDALLGYLDGKSGSGRSKSRSAKSSYADLQRLRKASNSQLRAAFTVMSSDATRQAPNPPLEEDGLRVRVPPKHHPDENIDQ